MIFIRFVRFLCGYIRVKVEGGFCERFINICVSNGFSIWNTHRRKNHIEFYMRAKDYKKIKQFRKKCFVKLKVTKKVGLPFYLHKHKSRKGVAVGLALYLAVLLIMPNFIWNIEINSNADINEQSVMNALEEMNIRIGTPVSKIKGENDRNTLNLKVEDISWSSLNVVGTTLNVEIRKKLDTRVEKELKYSNIVASCDGEVLDVFAYKGTAKVKRGAIVKKGDLLISGTEEYNNQNTYFRDATGNVIAKTKQTLKIVLPVSETKNVNSGKTEQRNLISFFSLKIPLFAGSVKYDYTKQTENKTLQLNGVNLPIEIISTTFYETEKQKITYSENTLNKMALEQLNKEKEEKLKNAEIISEDIKIQIVDNNYVLTCQIVCKQDISKKVYFEVDSDF
ncbi:MAG: sporulation protein YqfD [Acutalibacteraceae bacterium]|nr:sporulation protein YqfD [Acutalibacteraceae bacterium]